MWERLRGWWENLGPRERRLVWAGGAAVVVTLLAWVMLTVNDGLRDLDRRNGRVRTALKTLDEKRDQIMEERERQSDAVSQIPNEAIALATYLEKVGGEVGVQIRAQADQPTVSKGKFHELSLQITLFDVTLDQLAQFLKRIETNPIVVTQKLSVRRSTIAKDKMDRVDIVVSTYERAPEKKTAVTAKAEGSEAGK
jgi:type II secretory pathway component PulM